MALKLGQIFQALASRFDARLHGDPDTLIERLAPIESAVLGELSFLRAAKYFSLLGNSQASCLVVPPELEAQASQRGACIVAPDPYLYFACITQLWRAHFAVPRAAFIHPSASIAATAVIAADAFVGPFAVIEAGAQVASGAEIGAHGFVGCNAVIGQGSKLYARVTVHADCVLGKRCVVHSGVVIGADGFGFAAHAGGWEKIEQLGAVRIGDDVEIGANTCVDRGALGDTVIEDGVKLDNLIQIGHNVRIGRHSALAGCVGVAGSAQIGANCTVGGGAVVLGHLRVADGVHISAASVVTRSILKPGQHTGFFPIDDNAAWEKNAASLKHLNALREKVKRLEQLVLKSSKP